MKSLTTLIVLSFTIVFVQAQALVDKEITIGMTVKIMPCKAGKTNLQSMDMYRKTRIPTAPIGIDSATGEGVFENFFAPGDFDTKRLPCEYSNKKYKVAALRVFDDPKTGKEKRVMILYTKEPLTMIWVEFDKAIESGELTF